MKIDINIFTNESIFQKYYNDILNEEIDWNRLNAKIIKEDLFQYCLPFVFDNLVNMIVKKLSDNKSHIEIRNLLNELVLELKENNNFRFYKVYLFAICLGFLNELHSKNKECIDIKVIEDISNIFYNILKNYSSQFKHSDNMKNLQNVLVCKLPSFFYFNLINNVVTKKIYYDELTNYECAFFSFMLSQLVIEKLRKNPVLYHTKQFYESLNSNIFDNLVKIKLNDKDIDSFEIGYMWPTKTNNYDFSIEILFNYFISSNFASMFKNNLIKDTTRKEMISLIERYSLNSLFITAGKKNIWDNNFDYDISYKIYNFLSTVYNDDFKSLPNDEKDNLKKYADFKKKIDYEKKDYLLKDFNKISNAELVFILDVYTKNWDKIDNQLKEKLRLFLISGKFKSILFTSPDSYFFIINFLIKKYKNYDLRGKYIESIIWPDVTIFKIEKGNEFVNSHFFILLEEGFHDHLIDRTIGWIEKLLYTELNDDLQRQILNALANMSKLVEGRKNEKLTELFIRLSNSFKYHNSWQIITSI